MNLHYFSSTSLVGLDVQAREIRLIYLRKSRHEYLIEQAVVSELAAGIFVDGRIKQWDKFGAILTELVQMYGLTGTAASICLPVNLVRMQRLQLPQGLTDVLIEAEIKNQIERDFPGMTESLCIDFNISARNDGENVDVFFVVSRKEYIRQCVSVINSAGLKVKIVDIDVCALTRPFHLCPEFPLIQGEVYAIAYVSTHTASLIIFNADEMIHQQQWEMTDSADFLTQLKTHIQIFFALFRNISIHKLAIYGIKKYWQATMNDMDLALPFDVCYPDPFAIIKFGPYAQIKPDLENIGDFLVACGAAMREVPVW